MGKLTYYAISRHGSNAANQSFCEVAEIDIVSARSRGEAVAIAQQRVIEGRHTLYANQSLSARPLSSLSATDCQILEEVVYLAEREVESACVVCGKKLGRQPQWQAQNAWCGCDANEGG